MTVRIEYRAVKRKIYGRAVVRLERTVTYQAGRIDAVAVTLAPEDALALVRAYREAGDGRFEDVSGDGPEVRLEFVPWESYSLYWSKGLNRIEDDLWSDWPEAFMAEIESAAEEAMG